MYETSDSIQNSQATDGEKIRVNARNWTWLPTNYTNKQSYH